MGYRVSTAVFALLFAVMVFREVTRPEPEAVPRGAGNAAAETEDPAAPAVVPGERKDAPPTPESATEVRPDASAESEESTLDRAIRLLTGPASRRRRQSRADQLRPHADEVIPILEDWLRRREEIRRRGIELYGVPWAYAELAGPRALPLFEELVKEDADHWSNTHVEALTRIDDPRAVEALRRHCEGLPPNANVVNTEYIWAGAPGFRALVREWAVTPPANLPELKDQCMWSWFQWGTMEDREEAWSVLEERSRLRMLGANGAWRWPSPWPERFEATVRAELAADGAMRRYRALFSALGNVELSPDLVAEAERALERELEAAEARRDDVRPTHAELLALKERYEARHEERAAAQRKRDLLTPR